MQRCAVAAIVLARACHLPATCAMAASHVDVEGHVAVGDAAATGPAATAAEVAAAAAAELPDSLGNEVARLAQRHRELIRERQAVAKDWKNQKKKNQRCMVIARRLDNTTLIEIIAARAAAAKAKAKAKAKA